tara:strand:- start:4261 stop:5532 length:1272 start_codon:yes stop_codon:yes gene_type:complete
MKIYTNFTEFLNEKLQVNSLEDFVFEGGAAGHMMHPFDDHSLTFADFKTIVKSSLQGGLDFEEAATEKTDGQNLFATVKDGQAMFARNKGQMINPLDLNGIIKMFTGHASKLVEETYIFAAKDLAEALPALKDQSMFANGLNFVNMELIYSKNPNVIYYDRDVIQFHGIVETDGEGNQIGKQNVAGALVKALKELKSDVQNTFTIIPPQILKLAKDVDFESRVGYYEKAINKLRDTYSLSDQDEVKMYHEMWWRDQIEENFADLEPAHKEGLLLRWAYLDKKTLKLTALKKELTPEQNKAVKDFDGQRNKKYKENILPFENLFLELGADVLKNASNFVAANPDAEKARLHDQIRTEAGKIKKNGDLTQIAKVEKELKRLEGIGGIESIIPTEGVVFKFKGKTFKLTGTFAAINQLMGIIKYGR